jgi:pimeloyl-ACP methyl ester carboxylesterase
MPRFERGDVSIYYEEHGSGYPLLLIAPGGMNSQIDWWERAALNPLDVYAGDFRLVAMDQRNAGSSTGPLDVADPWGSFVDDQLALMDHLGHESFHVIGCCIGCSYALKLTERAPGRVSAAVLQQPIGIDGDNRALFAGMWREWGQQLAARREDIDPDTLEAFGTRMWEGEFVLCVPREFVRSCPTPLLVLPGIDQFHPTAIGREVAELAPMAELVEPWKDTPENVQRAVDRVREFLRERTNVGATLASPF